MIQRKALKLPSAQVAYHADRFEQPRALSSNSKIPGSVKIGKPTGPTPATEAAEPATRERLARAQQRLNTLEQQGAPQRKDYPSSPSGTAEYNEAKANYEREVNQARAQVELGKLRLQGAPKREDYPATAAGTAEYNEAKANYDAKLRELQQAAGTSIAQKGR